MGSRNRKRIIALLALVILVVVLVGVWVTNPAKADGPPPPEDPAVTDPFFREEAPERMVECDNNVFVPLGEGGTWECPPHPAEPDANDPRVAEQLPGEVIGRQVDCPDGTVGRIINMDLETTCEEVPGAYPSLSAEQDTAGPVARTTPELTGTQYTLAGLILAIIAAGTLHMIYRKQPGQ
jgi:hypothetical protein